jgi:hypothetical protein
MQVDAQSRSLVKGTVESTTIAFCAEYLQETIWKRWKLLAHHV